MDYFITNFPELLLLIKLFLCQKENCCLLNSQDEYTKTNVPNYRILLGEMNSSKGKTHNLMKIEIHPSINFLPLVQFRVVGRLEAVCPGEFAD